MACGGVSAAPLPCSHPLWSVAVAPASSGSSSSYNLIEAFILKPLQRSDHVANRGTVIGAAARECSKIAIDVFRKRDPKMSDAWPCGCTHRITFLSLSPVQRRARGSTTLQHGNERRFRPSSIDEAASEEKHKVECVRPRRVM